MRVPFTIIALLAITWLPHAILQSSSDYSVARNNQERRIRRQTSADQMVQNILHWLEGAHTQNNRKIRQEGLRTYLPPKQSPRPFEPAPPAENIIPGISAPDMPGQYAPLPSGPQYPDTFSPSPAPVNGPNDIMGPSAESSPFNPPSIPSEPVGPSETAHDQSSPPEIPAEQPTQPEINPEPDFSMPESEQSSPSDVTGYPPSGISPQPPFPPAEPVSPSEPEITGYPPAGEKPQPPFELPGISDHQETPAPIEPVPFPTDIPSIPTEPSAPSEATHHPSGSEAPDISHPIEPVEPTGYPLPSEPSLVEDTPASPATPGFVSTFPPILRETTTNPDVNRPETEAPRPMEPPSPTEREPSYSESPHLPEINSVTPLVELSTTEPSESSSQPSLPEVNEPEVSSQPEQEETETEKSTEEPLGSTVPPSEVDQKHPPHIHVVDVECAKDMMTINIEFNREFNGIIYSKGFYSNPECRYVNENSAQNKYSFTVKLDSCGTEFVNAFDTENQSYLENVLVLQNEADIQEVWDTIRSVRCLWEGNLSKSLTISLSVGMLSQETITFSGDTAVARLDIQRGEGPFAPSANGLVPIGEKMTLVISVSGDPGFDIHVKDCKATDTDGNLKYPLTDEDGCVLRPKLFGAFQKTRNTGNTEASIIAYAFFNAFKFPDLMDLMIECNVELCKTDCDVCPNPDQKIQPGKRRRRDIYNETIGEPVKIGKLLRVLVPEDLSTGETLVQFQEEKEFCVPVTSFVLASVFLISLLVCSILFSGYMFLKHRTAPYKHQL